MGLGHGADDRETQAEGAAAVTGAADEALEERVAQVLGHARAVVLDDEQRLTNSCFISVLALSTFDLAILCLTDSDEPVDTRIWVPAGVWRRAFSSRLIVSRWSSSRAPSTITGSVRPTSSEISCSSLTGPSSDAASTTIWARSHGSWGITRPTSVRASSKQIGDQPAHAL